MDYDFLTGSRRSEKELSEYLKALLNDESLSDEDITTDIGFIDENLNFLNKGVFWLIKDKLNNEHFITYKYSFDSLEALIDKNKYSYENVWKTLDKSITQNKTFYYFPRGRYEIRKGNKVVIYCSTFFAEEKYRNMIISKLKLKKGYKGIKSIKFIFDNSLHYHYTFDN